MLVRKLSTISMGLALSIGSNAAFSAPLNPEERFGKELYSDTTLSLNKNQSCESCHSLEKTEIQFDGNGVELKPHPNAVGFVDPDNVLNGTAVSDGSDPTKFGGLNAPAAGYAAFSPVFHYDDAGTPTDPSDDLYIGGQFWNGRAPYLRDQAAGPFLNPVEMAMPSKEAVIERLQKNPEYSDKFLKVYGIDLKAVQTDGSDPTGVNNTYYAMTLAIEAFERSNGFNKFTGKFDYVESGWINYTPSEQHGADLFDVNCAACHESTRENAKGQLIQGLMTDFSYDNIGVPANVNIVNPDPGKGLGGNPTVVADGRDGENLGKQKVMSLRNIELTPPYMHNGVLLTLEQVVHFYNTRDTLPRVCTDNNDPGFGVDCWPEPEVSTNENSEMLGTGPLGNLGMSAQDEADIVAYLRTFTDGYDQWGRDPAISRGMDPGYVFTPEEIMPARP